MLKIIPNPTSGGKAAVDAAGSDPSRYNVDLPFRNTFYPAGHALEVSSNSADVLATAAKLWQRLPVQIKDGWLPFASPCARVFPE